MATRGPKRYDPDSSRGKAFRLRFQGTSAKKFAPTLKAAVADAKYWLSFGQTKVCIERKTTHGTLTTRYDLVRCMHKRRRR